jgi:hypothetical protein
MAKQVFFVFIGNSFFPAQVVEFVISRVKLRDFIAVRFPTAEPGCVLPFGSIGNMDCVLEADGEQEQRLLPVFHHLSVDEAVLVKLQVIVAHDMFVATLVGPQVQQFG